MVGKQQNKGSNPRELLPYPYVTTPPSDPPTIRSNPKVDLALSSSVSVSLTTGGLITNDMIGDAIAALGYTKAKTNYALRYIHLWADSSLDAITISLTDSLSSVTSSDNGATTRRARVGLHYTKVQQQPTIASSSGTIAFVTSTGPSTDVELDVRFGVTVWVLQ